MKTVETISASNSNRQQNGQLFFQKESILHSIPYKNNPIAQTRPFFHQKLVPPAGAGVQTMKKELPYHGKISGVSDEFKKSSVDPDLDLQAKCAECTPPRSSGRTREREEFPMQEGIEEFVPQTPKVQSKPIFDNEVESNEEQVQAKGEVTIGKPNDQHEREAEHMADLVVQKLNASSSGNESISQTSPINSLQTKCAECEEEEQQEMVQVMPELQKEITLDNTDDPPDDENVSYIQRFTTQEREKTDYAILFKRAPQIQLSGSSGSESSIREKIVKEAQKMVGKIEAKKDDGAGRRVGADHLLEIFHLAANDAWSDEVIEYVKYPQANKSGFPHWCGIFAVYAIKKAGIDLGYWEPGRGVSRHGTLEPTDDPQVGDIGYFKEKSHHCIIKAVNGDTIESIDGNSGNFSEVIEKTRTRNDFREGGFFTPFTGSEKVVQKKDGTATQGELKSGLRDQLDSSSGRGSPLDEKTRSQMEAGFLTDFSSVSVHTDSKAIELNKALHAQAFTHGSDIYFNEGKYDPQTQVGKHLLAHELTHTLQQGSSTETINKENGSDLDENAEPFEGALEIEDHREEVKVALDQMIFDYIQYASIEDADFDELLDYKLEIASIKREILILDIILLNGLGEGLQDKDIDEVIQDAYWASLDEQETINMIVGEGLSTDEALELITYLMTSMPELFPDYIISLYDLAIQEFNEIAQTHADDYLNAIDSFNLQDIESIVESFIWMMENKNTLRNTAGTVRFFTWLDTERPFFLERKDESSTSTEISNLKVKINDHNIEFTSPIARENLDFLYPMLVSWHHFQFYSGVADKLDIYRRIVEVTYERLNEYGSYPDLVVDIEKTYYSSAPQVSHEVMRSGFDDIYERIEEQLDNWVNSLVWHEKIKEGFGLYDVYGEIGQQLKSMVTPTAIAMMVGFIAFLIAIQYVPYANIVVDAILIALGGIDILKGLTIFGMYFDKASEATAFRQLYKASQGLKGGGEAILDLLFELIGLAASKAIKAYSKYRNANRFESLDEIANDDIIKRGSSEIKAAFGEARSSSRAFGEWEEALNGETRRFLNDSSNSAIKEIYMEMRPDVRRILTHCASNCLIPSISRAQVAIVRSMIDRLGGLNPAVYSRLKVLIHIGKNDLDWVMRMISRVEDQAQLDRVLLQEFRRRAMEPPGGSPNINRATAESTPGSVTGGEGFPSVTNGREWLRPSGGAYGLIPRQVASQLRGRIFNTFAEFRSAFWQAVANDPILRQDFSAANRALMSGGNAPRTIPTEGAGGRNLYELHHVTPIEHGGGVYDLNNIVVASPRYHVSIHDSGFTTPGSPLLVQPKLESQSAKAEQLMQVPIIQKQEDDNEHEDTEVQDPAPNDPDASGIIEFNEIEICEQENTEIELFELSEKIPLWSEPIPAPPPIFLITADLSAELSASLKGDFSYGPCKITDIRLTYDIDTGLYTGSGRFHLPGDVDLRLEATGGLKGAIAWLGLIDTFALTGALRFLAQGTSSVDWITNLDLTYQDDEFSFEASEDLEASSRLGGSIDFLAAAELFGYEIWDDAWNLADWTWEKEHVIRDVIRLRYEHGRWSIFSTELSTDGFTGNELAEEAIDANNNTPSVSPQNNRDYPLSNALAGVQIGPNTSSDPREIILALTYASESEKAAALEDPLTMASLRYAIGEEYWQVTLAILNNLPSAQVPMLSAAAVFVIDYYLARGNCELALQYLVEELIGLGKIDASLAIFLYDESDADLYGEAESNYERDDDENLAPTGPTIISIYPAACENVSLLLTTVLHEFIHAQQQQRTVAPGDVDRFFGDVKNNEDEVQAYLWEIEHSRETGIFNYARIMEETWDNLRDYYSRLPENLQQEYATRYHLAQEMVMQALSLAAADENTSPDLSHITAEPTGLPSEPIIDVGDDEHRRMCYEGLLNRDLCEIPFTSLELEIIQSLGEFRNINIDPNRTQNPDGTGDGIFLGGRRPDDAPVLLQFRISYNLLDRWRLYINQNEQELYDYFESEFIDGGHYLTELMDEIKGETKRYKGSFRNLGNHDEQELINDFNQYMLGKKTEVDDRNYRAAKWYQVQLAERGDYLSITEIINRINRGGFLIWRDKWLQTSLDVNQILLAAWPPAKQRIKNWVRSNIPGGNPDSIEDLNYIGSLAKGYKGPPKQYIEFYTRKFDVDANLTAPVLADYGIEHKGADVDRGSINSGDLEIPEVESFKTEVHQELSEDVFGYDESEQFEIFINAEHSTPHEENVRLENAKNEVYELRKSQDSDTFKVLLCELDQAGFLIKDEQGRLTIDDRVKNQQDYDQFMDIINRYKVQNSPVTQQ